MNRDHGDSLTRRSALLGIILILAFAAMGVRSPVAAASQLTFSSGFRLGYVYTNPATIPWNSLTTLIDFPVITSPSRNGTIDTTTGGLTPQMMQADVLMAHQHGKKILISIGGADDRNWDAACNSSNRANFANNLVSLVQTYGYDGADLDIEQDFGYPTYPDYIPCVAGIRAALKVYSAISILATDGDPDWQAFMISHIAQHVDYIMLMSYWTAAGTGLQTQVGHYTSAGIPASKVVVGLGTDPTDLTMVDIGSSPDVQAKIQYVLANNLGGIMNWFITTPTPGTATIATYLAQPPMPTVVSVAPSTGPTTGGTSVTITGTNLSATAAVKFGVVAATNFTVNSATKVTATSPAGFGAVDITVTTDGGISATTPLDRFTYSGDTFMAKTAKQLVLTGSDGTSWRDMDPAGGLTLTLTPTVNSMAVLTGNADLWTANAGYNQDIGINVTPNPTGAPGNISAWKESGGSAGTFSPNAAAVQAVVQLSGGTTYTVKLQWKTNQPDPGSIFAGAGPWPAGNAQFSPTSLIARMVPVTDNSVLSAASTMQYRLANSDGSTWTDLDSASGTPLMLTVTPATDSTALLSGNVDLWTANAGFNQDVAIKVTEASTTQYPGNIVAWKESGGFAGTFSPNAAFVQGLFQMTHNVTYHIKLVWKTHRNGNGAAIFAGGGPWPSPGTAFSPTRLTVQLLPAGANPYSAVSTSQFSLANSDGTTWANLSTGGGTPLSLSVTPATNCLAILNGNLDLWTANAGFNQDIGISVSPSAGTGNIVAWKESGGSAGTFSPNAAFVSTVYPLSGGTSYTIKLVWKANQRAGGASLYAGAGPWPQGSARYSPSSLTAQLVSCV